MSTSAFLWSNARRRRPVGEILRRAAASALLALLNVRVSYRASTIAQLERGPAVVACNHVSLLDGVLLALASPVPMVFTSESAFSRHGRLSRAGMQLLMRLGYAASIQTLDANAPFGLRSCLRHLQEGRPVMVFPEGSISSTGERLAERPGSRWLAHRARVPHLQLSIQGAHLSRLFAKDGASWRPRIHVLF